jgi:predicted ABC-type ATPase
VLRLDLVVGPNGAGKSTFVGFTLAPALPLGVPFVNADEIARQRWPDDPESHSYEAARVAARTRDALIRARQPFIAETVFSHPSKLDLIGVAHSAGYAVFLHVLLVPEELAVRRVHLRVRDERLWSLVAVAIGRADAATVYDNTRLEGPRIVARRVKGMQVGAVSWPAWTPPALAAAWPGI